MNKLCGFASLLVVLLYLGACTSYPAANATNGNISGELSEFFPDGLETGDMVGSPEYQALLETHRDVERGSKETLDHLGHLNLNLCGESFLVSAPNERKSDSYIRMMDELAYMQVTLERYGYPNEIVEAVFGQIKLPTSQDREIVMIAPIGVDLVDRADNLVDSLIYSAEGKKDIYKLSSQNVAFHVASALNFLSFKLNLNMPSTNFYVACGGEEPLIQISSEPKDAKLSYISKFRHLYCTKTGLDPDNRKQCDYWEVIDNGGLLMDFSGRIVVSANWSDGSEIIETYNLNHIQSYPLGSPSGCRDYLQADPHSSGYGFCKPVEVKK